MRHSYLDSQAYALKADSWVEDLFRIREVRPLRLDSLQGLMQGRF